jgi:hypothetical protein
MAAADDVGALFERFIATLALTFKERLGAVTTSSATIEIGVSNPSRSAFIDPKQS